MGQSSHRRIFVEQIQALVRQLDDTGPEPELEEVPTEEELMEQAWEDGNSDDAYQIGYESGMQHVIDQLKDILDGKWDNKEEWKVV